MANVYVGGKSKKRGKFWLVLILVLVAVAAFFGFMFYKYNNLTSSPAVKADLLTYTISYNDDFYFVRLLNNNRKIMILKVENGTTFAGPYITLTSDNLDKATTDFLKLFGLNSNINYYFYLNDALANELTNKLTGNSSQGIDGLFDSLKTSKLSFWKVFSYNSYVKTVKEYDRNTNLDEEGFVALIKGFSQYAITSYDKLTIPTLLNKPITVNIGAQSYERKYANPDAFQRIKEIME